MAVTARRARDPASVSYMPITSPAVAVPAALGALDLQRSRQHDQDRRLAALGQRLGVRRRPSLRARSPTAATTAPRSRARAAGSTAAAARDRPAASAPRPSGPAAGCRESACGRSARSCVAISIRKMPSASSTFSDSSARNSSAVSDSVIDRSAAVIVAAIGAPSSSSSKPSAAGAVDSSCRGAGRS